MAERPGWVTWISSSRHSQAHALTLAVGFGIEAIHTFVDFFTVASGAALAIGVWWLLAMSFATISSTSLYRNLRWLDQIGTVERRDISAAGASP